jgi:acyl carrier protein
MDDINYNKIIKLIASVKSLDINLIHPDSRLDEDLGYDSISAMELLTELENEFSMYFSDEEGANIQTPRQILQVINARIAAG